MRDGEFLPGSPNPNWVSSMADDKVHGISPFGYGGFSREESMNAILSILKAEKRCRIIAAETDYIHAEFRTRIFRFVDDTEFYFPPGQEVIHIKSASRPGQGDLGVNRKRMEMLREKFSAASGKE